MSNKFPSTVIAHEGNSVLTDEPIAMILTGLEKPSSNIKTGAMVQAVVLSADRKPTDAVKTGSDENVCGNCPLRKSICYVNLVPWNKVYKSYQDGKVPFITKEVLERAKSKQQKLRITAYGDPAAVPFDVWNNLLDYFKNHTGYTHQWRNLDDRWSSRLMASVETVEGFEVAKEAGWSTFRVRVEGEPIMNGEIECPNIRNKSIKCEWCQLCNGNSNQQRHITVEAHGIKPKINKFAALK